MSDFNRSLLSHVPDGFFIPSAPACLPVSPLFFCIQPQHVLNYICKTRIRHNTPAETVLSIIYGFWIHGFLSRPPEPPSHTFMHSCIYACIRSYIHTCIHPYIHTFTHPYIHTFRLSCIARYCRCCSVFPPAKKQNGQKQKKTKKNKTDCTMLSFFCFNRFNYPLKK